ncbi:MAG: hypothetical protein IPO27_16070 [Bacteroidetes bacterium]|nr:hypothetical protein [Bacteroidota bacterium]
MKPFREYSWLGLALFAGLLCVYKTLLSSWQEGAWFIPFVFIGIILFFRRRQQRQDVEMRKYYKTDKQQD